jgi:hypothetical protein
MDYTRETFAEAVLQSLGYPVTKLAVTDIMSWEAAEGGAWNGGARYNPLNTTEPMSGATDFNSVGVKNYTSWEQGLNATVKTLENGYYTDILNALSIGGTGDFGVTVGESPWGTETFAVTGQNTKALTSPTDSGTALNLTNTTPPTLSSYSGLFINSDGVYQIKYSASIGADIANMGVFFIADRQASSISAVKTFNDGSKKTAAKYGAKSDKYIEWVNAQLASTALYGPNSATSNTGGAAGALTGLTLSTLTLKDLYIIIAVVLVGVLAVILIARAIKPAAQAVAPLAALAV